MNRLATWSRAATRRPAFDAGLPAQRLSAELLGMLSKKGNFCTLSAANLKTGDDSALAASTVGPDSAGGASDDDLAFDWPLFGIDSLACFVRRA
jgi:hypothetical protein